jgi:hypothetical protein
MQFYLPAAARKSGAKFNPRHFLALCEAICPLEVRFTTDLAEAQNSRATFVIRGPGSSSVSRASVANRSGEHFVFDHIEKDELAALRGSGARLLIDFGWEYFAPNPNVVKGLASALDEFGLDSKNVMLLHSNLVATPALHRLWQDVSSTPPPASLEFPVALALGTFHQERHMSDQVDRARRARDRLVRGNKSRLFACFNGEGRPHRFYFLAGLAKRGVLDRGYVSMLAYRKRLGADNQDSYKDVLRTLRNAPRIEELEPHLSALMERLPLVLDIETVDLAAIETLAWESQNGEYYDDSWFSVVLDTAFYEDDILFITEKVMKSVMNCSPFIYLGNAGAKQQLHQWGFETFSPAIVQPDSEASSTRMWSAIDEVTRLSALRGPDLHDLGHQLWASAEQNFDNFTTRLPVKLREDFRGLISAMVDAGG